MIARVGVLMYRYPTFAILLALWLTLFSLAAVSQKAATESPPPQPRSEPVLKVDDDAKTIIDKVVKANGGKEKFSRWNCGYLKYKTKGGVVPAQFGEVTIEDTFQLPGHFKRVTRMETNGKELLMVFVINNGKGWTKKGDAPAEPVENNFTERAEHPFA